MDKIEITLKVDTSKLGGEISRAAIIASGALANLSFSPGVQSLIIGAILSGTGKQFPMVQEAIEQNTLWEKRQAVYQIQCPEKPEGYGETLKAYQSMGEMVGAAGRSPDKAARVWTSELKSVWLTIKEVIEGTTRKKLPDIAPEDAIELGKTTLFSAEQWFRGCSDRKFWGDT